MNIITNNNTRFGEALAALKQVVDPEIGLDIVELGLIYQIDFDEDKRKVYGTMTLTTQFCPMGESITAAAEKALQTVFPEHEIILRLTFNPAWNHHMITEEGLLFLNH